MLAALLRFFGGDIAGQIRAAYEAKLNAENAAHRTAAEVEIERLEAIQKVRIASGGRWSIEFPCFVAGMTASCHYALVAFASTPFAPAGFIVHKLPAPMDGYQGSIILSFFGLSVASAGLRAFMASR